MNNFSFDVKNDIDSTLLYDRAYKEAYEIYKKPSTRKGRSLEAIIVNCMYGQAAEVYLLQNGFIDDTRPYKDLFEPVKLGSNSIEVKVTQFDHYVPYVLKRCTDRINVQKWMNHPKIIYVFINNKKDSAYSFKGRYKWNGNDFQLDYT